MVSESCDDFCCRGLRILISTISNFGVRVFDNREVIVYVDIDMIICDILIYWDEFFSLNFWFFY